MTRTELKELARLTAIELMKLMAAREKDAPKAPADGYMTMHEAADYLGCSYDTIRRNPAIPRTRVGKTYRYTRESLAAWAENRTN